MPNLKTISQLPETTEPLNNRSYFGVSVPEAASAVNVGAVSAIYASKKISKKALAEDMVREVSSYYERNNGIRAGLSVGGLYDDFYRFATSEFIVSGSTTFENAPKILETLDYGKYDDDSEIKKAVNLETLKQYSNVAVSPAIGENFGFVTFLSSMDPNNQSAYYNLYRIDSDGHEQLTTNGFYNWGLTPDIKNVSENQFVFHIEPQKKESNEWTAPATGIFTCYGWLDEIQTEKMSNESRWVALMGLKHFEDGDRWVILQLQPFVPNNFLSYVGFTFPVQAGMRLKIRTGFTTGSNSDKYFRASSSIANQVVNGFLGGVYTNLSISQNPDIEFVNTDFWNDLSNRVSKLEVSAENNLTVDHDQREDIDDLSSRLSAFNALSDYVDMSALSSVSAFLSNEIDLLDKKKVNYFDTSSDAAPLYGARIFFGHGEYFGCNNPYNLQTYLLTDNNIAQWIEWDWNKSVDWNLANGQSNQNFYAPPPFSEVVSENVSNGEFAGEIGTVERAWVREPGITPGAVFSDGVYYYYRVRQNCTARVTLHGNTTNKGGEYKFCILLTNTSRPKAGDADGVFLIDNIEGGCSNSSITVPVTAGSVFVFGLYQRQKLSRDIPPQYSWLEYSSYPAFYYGGMNTLGNPNTGGGFASMFTDHWWQTESTYEKYDANGNRSFYTLKTIRLNALGDNIEQLYVDEDPNKYNKSDASFGLLATVVEMP